jgi:hypothetical protein
LVLETQDVLSADCKPDYRKRLRTQTAPRNVILLLRQEPSLGFFFTANYFIESLRILFAGKLMCVEWLCLVREETK